MATVQSFSGYLLSDIGLALTPSDTFTIPASGPTVTFLADDADGTLSTTTGSNGLLYALDAAGTSVVGANGLTYSLTDTVTFSLNGGSFTGFIITDSNGTQYFVAPADIPEGSAIQGSNTATVTSVNSSPADVSYTVLQSEAELIDDAASNLDLSGADTLYGGDGNDSINAQAGNDLVYAGDGNDSVAGTSGSDTIYGGSGDDTASAGLNAGTIFGGQGDDTLTGSAEADSIEGGAGQDVIYGGDGADTITGDFTGAADVTSSRLSFNWSQLPEATSDGANLNAGVTQDTGGIQVDVSFTDDGAASVGGGNAFDFNGSEVSGGVPIQQNGAGLDTGGEAFNGNSAVFIGGSGGATQGVNNPTSTTRIDFSSTDPTLEDEVTNVQFRINDIDAAGWQDVVRVQAFDADGNRVDVTLTAPNNANYVLQDLDPNDAFGPEQVLANPGANNVTIADASGSLLVTVAGPVSRIEIDYGNFDTQFQRIDVTDIFFSTIPVTYDDSIFGGAGTDSIDGQEGADLIDGGADNDSLSGGADEDTFRLSDNFGTDTIFGGDTGTDQDTIDASSLTAHGVDIVFTAEEDGTIGDQTNALGTFDDIEQFALSEQGDTFDATVTTTARTIDGAGGNDTLRGGSGDDSYTGGTGDDIIEGGGGNDTLDGGANDTGGDTVSYNGAGGPVTVDLSQNTATGGAGNDTITNFENIEGSSFGDTALTGNDGNNVIDGNGGIDTMDGGGGNDTLITGGGDSVQGGTGTDTVSLTEEPDGNDVSITIDSQTLQGTDTAGGSYAGVEIYAADGIDDQSDPEADGTNDTIDDDEITISNILTPTDVPLGQFDATAAGTFTYATGPLAGQSINFGPGEAQSLQDLFTGGPNGGPLNGTYSITGGDRDGTISGNLSITGFETVNFQMVCFTRGTMIATPEGERAIEDLAEGDMVLTRDRGAQPLRWVGHRVVPALGKFAPVVFKPGAIGNDRELVVSPQHRMLVTDWRAELMFGEAEVLVAAKDLVNGDTIYVREGEAVDYFHILFDTHEIVIANGAASESFHPGATGLGMLEEAAREEVLELFPELREDADGYGQAARTSLKGWEAKALRR